MMLDLVLPSATVALIVCCLFLMNGMAPLAALDCFFLYFLVCLMLSVWTYTRPY